jgi:hypothetical protein
MIDSPAQEITNRICTFGRLPDPGHGKIRSPRQLRGTACPELSRESKLYTGQSIMENVFGVESAGCMVDYLNAEH